jgi:cytochrome c-type biogenesis protein CcmH
MTVFWLIAAALLVVVLVVLVRPLAKSTAPIADDTAASNLRILRAQLAELDAERDAGALDETQYASARSELEHRVLEESAVAAVPARAASGRTTAVALALALPLVAIALYWHLGNRDGLDPTLAVAAADPHAASSMDMEQAVQRLAERMQAEPDNVEGWALLGRSYAQMQRFEQARDAYAHAVQRKGDDAQLLADYADALAMTQGRKLDGEPEKLVLRALQIDPDHVKALALAGTAAMARRDYAGAVKYWERARALVPPDNPLAQGLSSGIAEARAAGGLGGGGAGGAAAPAAGPRAPAPAASAAAAAAKGTGLSVTVSLAPALASKVQPGDTLFVYARPAEGARMPLAIQRLPAASIGQQPVTVKLDDSLAMSPQTTLSSAPSVVVVARVSRQGGASAASGDLEGESAPRPNNGEVKLVIDRVRP